VQSQYELGDQNAEKVSRMNDRAPKKGTAAQYGADGAEDEDW